MNATATPAGAWLQAARPATLTVAISAVMVGAAASSHAGVLRFDTLAAALISATLIQIGTNFANDVFDAEKGADTSARIGPVRVVQAGLLSAGAVKAAMVITFALAALAGVYLVWSAGWPIVVIGLASIASGIAYTGGPWPLGYHGLGDAFVFAFFGPVAVCGTAFVATGGVPAEAMLASVSVGALATAVLVVNNVRDHGTDRVAGKRTVVVRFGRTFGVWEYRALLIAAYAVPVSMAVWRHALVLLLPLITLPFAMRLSKTLRDEASGPKLNEALASTAKLLLAFSVLFSAALYFR